MVESLRVFPSNPIHLRWPRTHYPTLYVLSRETEISRVYRPDLWQARRSKDNWSLANGSRSRKIERSVPRLYQNSFPNRWKQGWNRVSWRDEIFTRYSRLFALRVIWTGLAPCRDSFQENRSLNPRMKNKETRRGILDLVVSRLSGREWEVKEGFQLKNTPMRSEPLYFWISRVVLLLVSVWNEWKRSQCSTKTRANLFF